MPTYRFEEVKHPEQRRFTCSDCGKRCTRSCTFTNTINPLNVDPTTGLPRTYEQIVEKLRAEGTQWQPTQCASCEQAQRVREFDARRAQREANRR